MATCGNGSTGSRLLSSSPVPNERKCVWAVTASERRTTWRGGERTPIAISRRRLLWAALRYGGMGEVPHPTFNYYLSITFLCSDQYLNKTLEHFYYGMITFSSSTIGVDCKLHCCGASATDSTFLTSPTSPHEGTSSQAEVYCILLFS